MIVVDKPLLDAFRRKLYCEYCGRPPWPAHQLEPHHLYCRGMGGGGRLDVRENLVALCRECHETAQRDRQMNDLLMLIVAFRERTTIQAIQETIWKLRRTPKP